MLISCIGETGGISKTDHIWSRHWTVIYVDAKTSILPNRIGLSYRLCVFNWCFECFNFFVQFIYIFCMKNAVRTKWIENLIWFDFDIFIDLIIWSSVGFAKRHCFNAFHYFAAIERFFDEIWYILRQISKFNEFSFHFLKIILRLHWNAIIKMKFILLHGIFDLKNRPIDEFQMIKKNCWMCCAANLCNLYLPSNIWRIRYLLLH